MMGNCRSKSSKLSEEELEEIRSKTGFTKRQIFRLHLRFLSLDKKGRGFLERSDFLQIPELEINPLGDRIIDAFFAETQPPQTRITFTDFARVLAHFRPCSSHEDVTINSRSEKLRFAFAMYDLNKNGYITRQEFKIILNMMIGSNITPEQLESITDRTITEGDYEKNGKISFKEFCRAMESINVEQIMSIRFME
ncbi:Calcineurin B homologous protein 1 [Toxocara canis]|uniref:Calcineurin B homologous protein 1 n=1 Tax=Toxocara canis TaxID=6265 RepID=A0A0B2VE57_TOXCA|nr:Calcineurin B homologous protein 1 [Toxocara canis]